MFTSSARRIGSNPDRVAAPRAGNAADGHTSTNVPVTAPARRAGQQRSPKVLQRTHPIWYRAVPAGGSDRAPAAPSVHPIVDPWLPQRLGAEQVHPAACRGWTGPLPGQRPPRPEGQELRKPGSPPLLGLIESTTGGRTWKPLSLLGEADFHSLVAAHGKVYGYDSTGGRFLVSDDGKRWETRSEIGIGTFAVDPAEVTMWWP